MKRMNLTVVPAKQPPEPESWCTDGHTSHAGETTVVDPVCHMNVVPASAAGSYEYRGTTYSFCSTSCLERFKADPEAFLQPAPAKQAAAPTAATEYFCPMDPEIRQDRPGSCPKCGMALEPDLSTAAMFRVEYTCPMHPEIVRDGPGACPICGMALEPRSAGLDDPPNPELLDMTRRMRIAAVLGVPVFVFAMGDMVLGMGLGGRIDMRITNWIGLLCATPVVLWAGLPFFERAWASVLNRHANMFTLIALGLGAAYFFSVAATVAPGLFPDGFRVHGVIETYFDTPRSSSRCSSSWDKCSSCARAAERARRSASCSA